MAGVRAGDDVHRAGQRAHSDLKLIGVYGLRVHARGFVIIRTF
jgi:hypothetical protein